MKVKEIMTPNAKAIWLTEFARERRADREAEHLRIEVHDGAVDLLGRVHSWQEKRAIIGSIAHAPGVTQLKDHLRIDPYF